MKQPPEIAGGYVSGATLVVNKFAPNVFGCTVLKLATGRYRMTLDETFPRQRLRMWFQNMSALIPWSIFPNQTGANVYEILTSDVINDGAPAFNPTLTRVDFDFCFGVSIVPG